MSMVNILIQFSCFSFSAEQANRASVMGAFLRPESAAAAAAAGRRGSDPRRTTAFEQQHLAMVAEKRKGDQRNARPGGKRSREASLTMPDDEGTVTASVIKEEKEKL